MLSKTTTLAVTVLLAAVIGIAVGTAAAPASAASIARSSSGAAPVAQERAYVEGELILRLSMEVPVARAAVYDAWTIADQLVQWFPSFAEMTVTEGGEYHFGWDGWDGEWAGTYLEVERPERLVFTWQPPAAAFPEGAYETTVTLTFEEVGEQTTRLVLEHGGFQGGLEMESHLEAWRGYLYNLRAFLLQR